jgi:hypothetical protein
LDERLSDINPYPASPKSEKMDLGEVPSKEEVLEGEGAAALP